MLATEELLNVITDILGENIAPDLKRAYEAKEDYQYSKGKASPSKRLKLSYEGSPEKDDPADPLKPEERFKKYTIPRLQKGVRAVQNRQQRYMSPRAIWMLEAIEGAYKEAIDAQGESDESNDLCRKLETTYHRTYFMFEVPQGPTQEILDRCVKMQRFHQLQTYGDYVGEYCKEIRAAINTEFEDLKIEPHEVEVDIVALKGTLCRPIEWREVKDELDKGNLSGELSAAARLMNRRPAKLKGMINFYGERNQTFHSPASRAIDAGDFNKLGPLLHEDLQNVYNEPNKKIRKLLKKAMIFVRDKYFVFEEGNEDRYITWQMSPKAQAVQKEKIASAERSATQLAKGMVYQAKGGRPSSFKPKKT